MKKLLIVIGVFLFVISCGERNSKLVGIDNISVQEVGIFEDGFKSDTTVIIAQNQTIKQKHEQPITSNPDWDKKIVKTASLEFEIKDYKVFNSTFRDKIRQSGGYVSQEEQKQSDYRIENNVVIKVPVDQFDNLISQLLPGTDKIVEKKVASQDATMEYVDTKSRLEAKRQVRQRYLDLLKQAKNLEEILNVKMRSTRYKNKLNQQRGE
jgi:hypothetical protein